MTEVGSIINTPREIHVLITARQRSWGKVMFSQMSDILFGGGYPWSLLAGDVFIQEGGWVSKTEDGYASCDRYIHQLTPRTWDTHLPLY